MSHLNQHYLILKALCTWKLDQNEIKQTLHTKTRVLARISLLQGSVMHKSAENYKGSLSIHPKYKYKEPET